MPLLPRTTVWVELGTLLQECNKRYRDKMFYVSYEQDLELNRTGRVLLIVSKYEEEPVVGKMKKVELVIKDLLKILGDYYYGD